MKSIFQNRLLVSSIVASVTAHAALLAVRFTAADVFKLEPTDPTLEAILVNMKHRTNPLKSQALAQASLGGGGNADAGRAKLSLPDMRTSEDGDNLMATKYRIEQLEQQQQMLAQMHKETPLNFPTKNGPNLYGRLVVHIPIYQDGSLYTGEGGVRIEPSSGNPELCSATLKIIERSTPFGRFSENMRSSGKDDVWGGDLNVLTSPVQGRLRVDS